MIAQDVDRLEVQGYTFEILKIEKRGEQWYCRFAVDSVPVHFFEPAENTEHFKTEEDFLNYLKAQSLTALESLGDMRREKTVGAN